MTEVTIHVARYGDYDQDRPKGRLAFPDRKSAKEFIDSTASLSTGEEWEHVDPVTARAEDKIGNWAEIEKVRISDPVGLFDTDS